MVLYPGDFQARLSCCLLRREREKRKRKAGGKAEWKEGGRIEVGRHRLYIVHKLSI